MSGWGMGRAGRGGCLDLCVCLCVWHALSSVGYWERWDKKRGQAKGCEPPVPGSAWLPRREGMMLGRNTKATVLLLGIS